MINIHLAILILLIILIIYIFLVNETIRYECYQWIVKTHHEANAIFNSNITGIISFKEDLIDGTTIINIDLKSESNDKYKIKIYNNGQYLENNLSVIDEYNPNNFNVNKLFDNIEFNDGKYQKTFRTKQIKLRGYYSILGHYIAIEKLHSPDQELGINEEPLIATIGYIKNNINGIDYK